MTRLTLRAILILGLLSSGVLAAPASTRPSSKDQALCPCSNRPTGVESESAPGVLKARGCCCSCCGSRRAEGEQAVEQFSSTHLGTVLDGLGNINSGAVEHINQIMPKLGHAEKQAADKDEVVPMLLSLPEPAKPLADEMQEHYRALIGWVTVLSNRHARANPGSRNPFAEVLEKLENDSGVTCL
ncbi:hypothetical protein FB446DRAFT_717397, partial [Lentinula raphanica]